MNPRRRRALIIAALISRLQAVTMANDFLTDAGQNIFTGETPQLGPDDPDIAFAVVPGDETVLVQGEKFGNNLPIEIQAVRKLSSANVGVDEWVSIEDMLSDIKSAIETGNRAESGTIDGLVPYGIDRSTTRTVPREPGSTVVAAGITYIAQFTESWGDR